MSRTLLLLALVSIYRASSYVNSSTTLIGYMRNLTIKTLLAISSQKSLPGKENGKTIVVLLGKCKAHNSYVFTVSVISRTNIVKE